MLDFKTKGSTESITLRPLLASLLALVSQPTDKEWVGEWVFYSLPDRKRRDTVGLIKLGRNIY